MFEVRGKKNYTAIAVGSHLLSQHSSDSDP